LALMESGRVARTGGVVLPLQAHKWNKPYSCIDAEMDVAYTLAMKLCSQPSR